MSSSRGGRGAMTKTPITLQDLRRRLYVKAKAEPSWRFWGLYGHLCKRETLRTAYQLAKQKDGAPGTDGVTFEAIEADGADSFLDHAEHIANDKAAVEQFVTDTDHGRRENIAGLRLWVRWRL